MKGPDSLRLYVLNDTYSPFCLECATMVYSRKKIKKINRYNSFSYVIDVLKNVVGKRSNFYMVPRIQKQIVPSI